MRHPQVEEIGAAARTGSGRERSSQPVETGPELEPPCLVESALVVPPASCLMWLHRGVSHRIVGWWTGWVGWVVWEVMRPSPARRSVGPAPGEQESQPVLRRSHLHLNSPAQFGLGCVPPKGNVADGWCVADQNAHRTREV